MRVALFKPFTVEQGEVANIRTYQDAALRRSMGQMRFVRPGVHSGINRSRHVQRMASQGCYQTVLSRIFVEVELNHF